jgi:hypothetical protein
MEAPAKYAKEEKAENQFEYYRYSPHYYGVQDVANKCLK